MHSAVENLFRHARSRVTEQDIIDFSPGDPGYPDYVAVWSHVLRSGEIPRSADFDLTETIGLTGWAEPGEKGYPDRFQIYRRFTSAVAVALVHFGNDCEGVRPANYLARDLLIDIDRGDAEYLALVRAVFPPTIPFLVGGSEEVELPFWIFGEMILAQWAGDFHAAAEAATRLIRAEGDVRSNESVNYYVEDDRFLLGLTVYDQLHRDWKRFAKELVNPNQHEDTQLVIEAMAENWCEGEP